MRDPHPGLARSYLKLLEKTPEIILNLNVIPVVRNILADVVFWIHPRRGSTQSPPMILTSRRNGKNGENVPSARPRVTPQRLVRIRS